MASNLAVIGGTGLNRMQGVSVLGEEVAETPFGTASAALMRLALDASPQAGPGPGAPAGEHREFVFLARHGRPHRIPPHGINYRANLWALKEAGIRQVLAVNAVGGIGSRMGAGVIAIPDQIVDYTWGRAHTFYDGQPALGDGGVEHVDFTEPYTQRLRLKLLDAAASVPVAVVDGGVYAATQGPRLESAAEIRRLARDGCELVGMTGMPEAALARELGLEYASLCLVVNPAAGEAEGEITMEDINRVLAQGMDNIHAILAAAIAD